MNGSRVSPARARSEQLLFRLLTFTTHLAYTSIVQDKTVLPPPLPPPHDSPAEDDELLKDFPWVEAPVRMDYGYNVK